MRKGDKKTGRSFVVIRPDGRVTVEVMSGGRIMQTEIQKQCGGTSKTVETACWDDLVLFVPAGRSKEGLCVNRAATALVHPGEVVCGVAVLSAMEDGEPIGLSDRAALLYARMMVQMAKEKECIQ